MKHWRRPLLAVVPVLLAGTLLALIASPGVGFGAASLVLGALLWHQLLNLSRFRLWVLDPRPENFPEGSGVWSELFSRLLRLQRLQAQTEARLQEALKEVTALQSAEQIVRRREDVKNRTLAGAKEKVAGLLVIEDLVIENITLSKELESAIEAKMVQEQEAAKSRFTQQKAQIEADTAIIKAKGEAEAIRIRGEALRDTPGLIQLQIVEKWDGKAPLVIGGSGDESSGTSFILPLNNLPLPATTTPAARRP